jgi:putative dimethyl sulfoxide reductase chaperone
MEKWNPMDLDEFHELMKARRNVYDLLRCLFLHEPSEKFLQALKEEEILDHLSGYEDDLDDGVNLVSAVVSDPRIGALIPDLVDEFTRLFIGPLPVPLYESVYRSKEGLVMQEHAAAVRRKYFEAGLVVDPRQSFPEDHIGAELEFVYYLCQRTENVQDGKEQKVHLQRQQDFFREHLAVWVSPLCDRLFAAAESSYFRGIARLTKGFVTWDYRDIVSQWNK